MHSIFKLSCVLLLGLTMMSGEVRATDHDAGPRAMSGELPAALQAIRVSPREVLTAREASQVRGNWILTLSLPYYATQIQGYGPFTLQLWTISGGIAPGTPVYVRVSIGR
jgi:hypothetical protein